MHPVASQLMVHYGMEPHPEGGYYLSTYRSEEMIQIEHLPARYVGERHFSSAILYLLDGNDFSSFHRLKSDEIWHFYSGSALKIYVISPGGDLEVITLGSGFEYGETFQAVVRAGHWFASTPSDVNGYSLSGCTLSPGFDFYDFELADANELSREFPQHQMLVRQFCR